MSNEQPVRKSVVRALINAHNGKYPIVAVAQVEVSMKPTEAERAAAQEAIARPRPVV
jgi:formaldehyde-activating enzyme involved in methanogenesis